MNEPENTKVRKELINLLDELDIEDFTINTEEKKLLIHYREDFDVFFPRLNARPEVPVDRDKILPYGATHFASFGYNGWHIKGNILAHKESKVNMSKQFQERDTFSKYKDSSFFPKDTPETT